MKPEDIGRAYDQITHLWERDDFNRQNGVAQHKRALAFVERKGKALDVGCGCTGRFIELLIEAGFVVEGVDVSEQMIALARQRHPNVLFHLQDICEWASTTGYDFVTAWDSLWHLPIEQQAPTLTKLMACLNPGGVLIFSFGGTVEAGFHTDHFMGPEVYYSTLGVNGFLKLVMDSGCICRHLEYDQYPELHAYLIVQKI